MKVTYISSPKSVFKKSLDGESEKYCMPRLQHLELYHTQILDDIGRVIIWIGVFPNLQHLLVYYCNLIYSCNHLLGLRTMQNAFVKLKLIDCCQMRKIEGLCSLTKLQELEIKDCIEVEELPCFETLTSLELDCINA